MSGLFGGNTARNSQARQLRYARKEGNHIASGINNASNDTYNMLMAERDKLANAGFGYTSSMPGYNIDVGVKDGTGHANFSRTGETQGFMDRLMAGLGSDEAAYKDLLSQIRPGFGRLSEAMQEQVKNTYAQKYGNLRDQLSKRRVLGSSFADADLSRMDLEKDQQMRATMAESMVQELKMTGDVLKAQTDGRNQALATAFSQIQFEGNMGINLTNMVMTSMNNNLEAQQELIKLAAGIKMQGALGAGNIQGNLANTTAGSFPGYAELQSNIDAGPMNFLGTVLGAAATGYAGRPK